MDGGLYDPYCGSPPDPTELLARWNLDPILIAIILLAIVSLFASVKTRKERGYTVCAFGLLIVAFVSPLCALTSSLFSARAVHHLLVTSLLAPCIVLALQGQLNRLPRLSGTVVSSVLFLLVLWAWHLPVVYDFALSGSAAYWLMQSLLIVTSLWLWHDLLSSSNNPGVAAATALFAATQMGLLGALLTFSSRPLFAPHFMTTDMYGIDALTDQQLAGLIMWVPSALPFILVAIVKLLHFLKADDAMAIRA